MRKPERILEAAIIVLLVVVALALCFSTATAPAAAPPVPVTFVLEADYKPIPGSYQKITGLDTAKTLTVPAGARRCLMYGEGDATRWTDDGTNPDPATTIGGVIAAGQYVAYNASLSAIELKGTAASVIHVFYYGP